MAVEWIKKNLAFLLGGLAIFIMSLCFISGCRYHKFRHPCPKPSIITNTVLIHDTIIHQIVDTFPFYIVKNDTVIYTETIIQPVDTTAILKDYFALHVYSRQWEDSLLKVNLRDTITENRFLGNDFQYLILRPQSIINTTVDNSVNYSRYIYGGLDVPFYYLNGIEIELMFAFERGYIGGGYAPHEKSGSLKAGFTLFKFK